LQTILLAFTGLQHAGNLQCHHLLLLLLLLLLNRCTTSAPEFAAMLAHNAPGCCASVLTETGIIRVSSNCWLLLCSSVTERCCQQQVASCKHAAAAAAAAATAAATFHTAVPASGVKFETKQQLGHRSICGANWHVLRVSNVAVHVLLSLKLT
jgi:hypothetical protein